MPMHTYDFWIVITFLLKERKKKDRIFFRPEKKKEQEKDKPTVLPHQAHSMLKALPLEFILPTRAAKEHFVYSPVTNPELKKVLSLLYQIYF